MSVSEIRGFIIDAGPAFRVPLMRATLAVSFLVGIAKPYALVAFGFYAFPFFFFDQSVYRTNFNSNAWQQAKLSDGPV
jgi:hypothetical protein